MSSAPPISETTRISIPMYSLMGVLGACLMGVVAWAANEKETLVEQQRANAAAISNLVKVSAQQEARIQVLQTNVEGGKDDIKEIKTDIRRLLDRNN